MHKTTVRNNLRNTNHPTEEQIRARAYELFVECGRRHGHDEDDWLQAEYELRHLPVRKLAELKPPAVMPPAAGKKSLLHVVRIGLLLA